MWNSITLKRSLVQIGKTRTITKSSSAIGNAANISHPANGGFRVFSTRSEQSWSAASEHAPWESVSFGRTEIATERTTTRCIWTSETVQQDDTVAAEDIVLDRTHAAEQMANLMDNSYYYASFKARGSHEDRKA